MLRLTAYLALAMAGGLLGLQLLAAYEYTQGSSLYTMASMMAAMIMLAALPVFVEAARHARAPGIAIALGVAFLAFLAYSLPATTGRTGEVKAAKVAEVAAVARIRDDLERIGKTLEYARPDMISECGGGEGKRCRGKRNTVIALEERQARLQTELAAAEKASPGDVGASVWSWATAGVITEDTIRRGSILAFAVGLDFAIWSLIWLATWIFVGSKRFQAVPAGSIEVPANDPLPPVAALPEKRNDVVDWCREFRRVHGRSPSIPEVQAAFPETPKTSAWRAAKAA